MTEDNAFKMGEQPDPEQQGTDPMFEGTGETPPGTQAPETQEAEAPYDQDEQTGDPRGAPGTVEAEAQEQTPAQVAAEAKKFADRYDSVEELEKGYKQLQGEYTRARQAEMAGGQRLARAEQLLRTIAQEVQAQRQQQQLAQAQEDPDYAAQLNQQAYIDQQVQARLAPLQQRQQAQAEQQQLVASIIAFRNAHQDIVPNSPEDVELNNVVEELELDKTNPEALEVGYEAFKNPELRRVLVANPHLVETEQGMEYARYQAKSLAQGSGAPVTGTAPTTSQRAPQRKAPPMESGGSGTPPRAPEEKKGDEFDESLRLYLDGKSNSVFGL